MRENLLTRMFRSLVLAVDSLNSTGWKAACMRVYLLSCLVVRNLHWLHGSPSSSSTEGLNAAFG